MEFLDALDNDAERIQAVNTVARTPQGRLIGHNTDGQGFIDSILTVQPGNEKSFLQSLEGLDVLLLGAGGSARAVAFHLCDRLQGGRLVIANRTLRQARSLATELENSGARVTAISEEEIASAAPRVGMIINTTIKGQGGIRTLPDGRVTNLEPYSALAPAHAPVLASSELTNPDYAEKWRDVAQADIEANNRASMDLVTSIPTNVVFYDLIYHPAETVFLRHGKATGHRTLNGKAMIVCQAVIGFCRILGQRELDARPMEDDVTKRRIAEMMYEAW
jgi:shikimate 5-dehydrogenase